MTKEEYETQHKNLLQQVRSQYKPRLKNLSKNQLIDMIIEISTELAYMRGFLNSQQPKKDSNE